MNKRGISGVITTVLLVFFGIAAIFIIWTFISPLLEVDTEGVEAGSLSATLKVVRGEIDSGTGDVRVYVRRDQGAGDVAGYKIILEDSEGNTFVKDIEEELNVFETSEVTIGSGEYSSLADVKKISVIPIVGESVEGGAVGNLRDDYVIGEDSGSGGGLCGNGVLDSGEECDGTEFGGASCSDNGQYGSQISCTAGCTIDYSGCTDYPVDYIGYWNFDDGTVGDLSGNGLDGTIVGSSPEVIANGHNGNGIRFYGINQHYIDLGNEESTLNVQEGSYSVVAWVNFTDKSDEANANQDWFFMGDSEPTSTRNGSVMRFNSNSQTVVWVTNWNAPVTSFSSINSGSTTLTHGEWHQIGYTYDISTGERTIYINGVAVASDLNGGTEGHRNDEPGASSMRIGQGTANRPVNGTLDEVMLFDRALSSSEVMDIYNALNN